jgi:hypothetical protein
MCSTSCVGNRHRAEIKGDLSTPPLCVPPLLLRQGEGEGDMVRQTMDLFAPFWQNVKVEMVTPKEGYRYLSVAGMFERSMSALNEKGVANTD